MKKSTFLIIISAVTVFCIIMGSYYNLRFSAKGFRSAKNAIKRSFSNGDLDFDDDFDDNDLDNWDEDFDEHLQEIDSATLDKFDKLSVDASVMGIVIERGSDYSIKTKYSSKRLKPSYSLNNGRLYLTQPKVRSTFMGNYRCKAVITVPYGTKLDKLDIEVNVGAIELSGFDVDTASISTDVGAISISQLDFEEMSIRSDVGAVSIALLSDVEDYDIHATSDVGAIEVNGKGAKRRYVYKGANGKKLRIKTDVGGIEIK